MTDKQALYAYRMKEADETLLDAGQMLETGIRPRSVVNRAYYAMFYALLALFIERDLNPKTSKHSGIIAIFDREFVHPGVIGKDYSRALHRIFELRQQSDYKELVEISEEEAATSVKQASDFVGAIKKLIAGAV